ncbi:site-specific integrase [Ornithobacterium rhinotracheale]|uniref:site-specific integrase n=2 Tax=Ornithobacterium rhinotracheale TaxID=28251 RepID=UPI003FA47A66
MMQKTQRTTFTVLFYLKRKSPKADGTLPIMARITINGKNEPFSTKLGLSPSLDLQNSKVCGKTHEAKQINKKLKAIENDIQNIYSEMLKYEGYVTAKKVKDRYLGREHSDNTLLKCFQGLLKDFALKVDKKLRARASYNTHKSAYANLASFLKEKLYREDIDLIELDRTFIDDYDSYLRIEKGLDHNSIYGNMGPLLRTIKRAINEDLLLIDPFRHYKNTLKSKDRGYLLKAEIEKIINYRASQDFTKRERDKLELVRDLFLFSCFTGFAYIDIKQLNQTHKQHFFDGNQWLVKRRQKSKIPCNVRLLEIPKMILKKYEGLGKNGALLPVPSNTTCNKYIKKIMNECSIFREKPITFHWARHSFATLMLTEDIPIESISKMLGHKHIHTTEIYAKITSAKISKDMEIAAQKLQNLSVHYH